MLLLPYDRPTYSGRSPASGRRTSWQFTARSFVPAAAAMLAVSFLIYNRIEKEHALLAALGKAPPGPPVLYTQAQ